jgi:hypothetical protein
MVKDCVPESWKSATLKESGSVFVVEPDVPPTDRSQLPAPVVASVAAFTVTCAWIGNELTEVGLTLQLAFPEVPEHEVMEHDKFTVPAKPFTEVRLIDCPVVVLPALTVGNDPEFARQKSGLVLLTGRLNCHIPRP